MSRTDKAPGCHATPTLPGSAPYWLAGKASVVLIAPLLCAASCTHLGFLKPDPLPLEIDPACRTPCPQALPQLDWKDGTADELRAVYMVNRQVYRTNADILAECEQHRQACALPIKRAEEAGAVKVTEPKR